MRASARGESRRRALSRVFLLVFQELPERRGRGGVLITNQFWARGWVAPRKPPPCGAARRGARLADRRENGGGRVRDNVFNYLQDVT